MKRLIFLKSNLQKLNVLKPFAISKPFYNFSKINFNSSPSNTYTPNDQSSKSIDPHIHDNLLKGELFTSPIRLVNIGKNYFRYINPRRKKILMALLNSYIKQFTSKESQSEIITVLDLYYNNEFKSKKFSEISPEDIELSESSLWHINAVTILDRIASQYSRFEFMEYDQMINSLNQLPKEKRNKAKYVFTNQANQPNSMNQLYCINEIFKGLEENDLDYLDKSMEIFRQQNLEREFTRPTCLEELITYYSSCIPDLINSFSNMYELGLKDLQDFFETPETCIFISDEENGVLKNENGDLKNENGVLKNENGVLKNENGDLKNENGNLKNENRGLKNGHSNQKTSLITYIHGLNINLTIDQYINLIKEAQLETEMSEILESFIQIKNYAKKLMDKSDAYRYSIDNANSNGITGMSKTNFFLSIPVTNVSGIESHIDRLLKEMRNSENRKVAEISKKLISLLSVFKSVGVLVQIKLNGEDLKMNIVNDDKKENTNTKESTLTNLSSDSKMNTELDVKEIIKDILKELSILNTNVVAGDIIVFDYENLSQYNTLQKLLEKYGANNIEIVPLIKSSHSVNDTNSNITLISASETRQREGLILSELRNFREYKNNPNKWIYMGQGNTAERGGGPFGLTHQKYNSLTRVQRQRHIRTVQGYYFTSEFCSKDLIFTFLVNGAQHLNVGDYFEPTTEYIDFLYELDTVVGVPQREMQKSKEFNDLYVNNQIIKTLVETFDYAGSEDKDISLTQVKETNPIVQAYINSDRCSFTHPELAYWDRLDENLIKQMAKNYYDNNRHFKYILYSYAFMLKRYDLEFAKCEVGLDETNPVFQNYVRGRNALEKILNNIGLSTTSTPIAQIYNQHLGLLTNSSNEETTQKFEAYRMMYLIQNFYLRKYLRDQKTGNEASREIYLKKMRILQSTLANISTFNGKG